MHPHSIDTLNKAIANQALIRSLPQKLRHYLITFYPVHEGIVLLRTGKINIKPVVYMLPWFVLHLGFECALSPEGAQ